MSDLFWHRRTGGGPPLLLVPGIGAGASHFGALSAALSGRDLITYDPRGCGQSPALAPGTRLGCLIADLEGVLDAAGAGRAYLLGASFGGILARLLAVARPGRVAGLVLVGTRRRGEAPGRPPKGVVAKGAGPQARAEAWLGGYGAPGWQARDPAGFQAAAKAFAAAPARPGTVAAQQAALDAAGPGLVAALEVGCPSLVVHGEEDPVVPVADGAALAAALGAARFVRLSPCGHLVSWERPFDLARLAQGHMGV